MLFTPQGTANYPVILQEKKGDDWQDLFNGTGSEVFQKVFGGNKKYHTLLHAINSNRDKYRVIDAVSRKIIYPKNIDEGISVLIEGQLFSIPEDKLKTLLDSFTVWLSKNDEAKTHIDALKNQSSEIQNTFLKRDFLNSVSDEDFYQKVFEYTRRLEGPAFIRLGEPRIKAKLKDIKRNLLYLIESDEDPFEKTQAVLDGYLKIPLFAKSFWSPIFQSLHPDLMPNWNNKTERFLEKLGINLASGKRSVKDKYRLLSDTFKHLQSLKPENDFYILNHLMHYGTAVDEGVKLLKTLTGNDEEKQIQYWQIAPGEGAKHWEDFKKNEIVAVGFDRIKMDLSGKSKRELQELFQQYYPDSGKKQVKIQSTQLWNFINLNIGDRFITNKGKSLLLGIGNIRGKYVYRPERSEYPHTVDVKYLKISDSDISLPKKVGAKFGRTIMKLEQKIFDQLDTLIDEKTEKSIWWVNQGTTLNIEKEGEFIWAPLRSKSSRSVSDWESLSEIKKEDIILHYANGALRYVSKVLQEAITQKRPEGLPSEQWEDEGRLVKTQYTPLNPPVQLNVFQEKLVALNLPKGPLNESGGVKQGYLFKLNDEAFDAIVRSYTETQWPDFLKIGPPGKPPNPIYTIEDCANETGLSIEQIASWTRAIETKGQAILYGPPGTGKTYIAERLGKHLISNGDGFCDLVQFHPTYSYEDFIQGIRPKADDKGNLRYPTVKGRFLEFCEKAEKRKSSCVLIIDEINRANLSRVFGELMYLLEYRDKTIPLSSGGVFKIPKNVQIIGTMNTADRSIALVDHALRRRFAFFSLSPNYEILKSFHLRTGFKVDGLIYILQQLNSQIGDRHYEVGITYFLRQDIGKQIEDVWKMEIEPYLEEYFFDQPERVSEYRWDKIVSKLLI